jgi:hypothetical protein
MFRALRYLEKPSTIIRFPGERHDLSRSGKPAHRVERLQRQAPAMRLVSTVIVLVARSGLESGRELKNLFSIAPKLYPDLRRGRSAVSVSI